MEKIKDKIILKMVVFPLLILALATFVLVGGTILVLPFELIAKLVFNTNLPDILVSVLWFIGSYIMIGLLIASDDIEEYFELRKELKNQASCLNLPIESEEGIKLIKALAKTLGFKIKASSVSNDCVWVYCDSDPRHEIEIIRDNYTVGEAVEKIKRLMYSTYGEDHTTNAITPTPKISDLID